MARLREVIPGRLPENGDGIRQGIGRELGKPVLMTQEDGSPVHPEHDRVVLLAEPL
ncbi:hypothetical protein [Amycolatopsis sp. WAC 04169]|uniref:hypothetical protein n=1 Tax=Amycolatopsis sp. WAC 04169 TaxID=2203197 RepID=UPI0013158EE1|nr:hypothetical protein [Amycolatopsis sp. WAC 04169]